MRPVYIVCRILSMKHFFPAERNIESGRYLFLTPDKDLCRTFFSSDFFVIYYYKRLMQRFYDYSMEWVILRCVAYFDWRLGRDPHISYENTNIRNEYRDRFLFCLWKQKSETKAFPNNRYCFYHPNGTNSARCYLCQPPTNTMHQSTGSHESDRRKFNQQQQLFNLFDDTAPDICTGTQADVSFIGSAIAKIKVFYCGLSKLKSCAIFFFSANNLKIRLQT